jgi:hypothetical protein
LLKKINIYSNIHAIPMACIADFTGVVATLHLISQ